MHAMQNFHDFLLDGIYFEPIDERAEIFELEKTTNATIDPARPTSFAVIPSNWNIKLNSESDQAMNPRQELKDVEEKLYIKKLLYFDKNYLVRSDIRFLSTGMTLAISLRLQK